LLLKRFSYTNVSVLEIIILVKVAIIIAMYCHIRPPDAIAFGWCFISELQTNPMPFHLESLWGSPLISDRGCAMDW